MTMDDKIKELKDLLFELDSKHSVSVPDTQQNINNVAKKIVKLFAIPVVIVSDFCECEGVQDLHAMTGECRKCGKQCTY